MTTPNKRDDIVRSAMELIAEHGFHGAPMAMVAERAGVGAGTIYRYFENKEILIIEMYQEIEAKMYALILDGYANEAPIRARFIHLWTALLRYFIQFPLDFRYLEQFRNSPYGVACRRDKILGNKVGEYNVFRELFEQGAAQQVVKDLPLVILFSLSFGPLLAVTRDYILGFVELDETMIKRTIEACWDAVKR
jgi:AcrR family transcriptional regulator